MVIASEAKQSRLLKEIDSLDCFVAMLLARTEGTLRPHSGRNILLDAGLLLGRNRALVCHSLLQAVPVSGSVGSKILGEPDGACQPQGIADDDIGRGETTGA